MAMETREDTIVKDNTKVFFVCGAKPIEVVHCESGNIVPSNKHFNCTCEAFEDDDDTIECSSVNITKDTAKGETQCFKMCGGVAVEKSVCQDGEWTLDLTEVKCPRYILNDVDVDVLALVIIIVSVIVFAALLLFWVMSLAIKREKSGVC